MHRKEDWGPLSYESDCHMCPLKGRDHWAAHPESLNPLGLGQIGETVLFHGIFHTAGPRIFILKAMS